MKLTTTLLIFLLTGVGRIQAADGPTRYENKFAKAEVGSTPEDLLILDGAFTVAEENENKFLELPGAPLETYGFLFGPSVKQNWLASARIYGTGKGRRFPTFAVGLNGVGGFKLRVSPAKKAIELYRGEDLKTSVPFDWKSGKWTSLEIAVKQADDTTWKIVGKVWQEGSDAPIAPQIEYEDKEAPPNGRATIMGSPYAGTPIRFDDLVSAPIVEKKKE